MPRKALGILALLACPLVVFMPTSALSQSTNVTYRELKTINVRYVAVDIDWSPNGKQLASIGN